jgi:hypothetical protein
VGQSASCETRVERICQNFVRIFLSDSLAIFQNRLEDTRAFVRACRRPVLVDMLFPSLPVRAKRTVAAYSCVALRERDLFCTLSSNRGVERPGNPETGDGAALKAVLGASAVPRSSLRFAPQLHTPPPSSTAHARSSPYAKSTSVVELAPRAARGRLDHDDEHCDGRAPSDHDHPSTQYAAAFR